MPAEEITAREVQLAYSASAASSTLSRTDEIREGALPQVARHLDDRDTLSHFAVLSIAGDVAGPGKIQPSSLGVHADGNNTTSPVAAENP
jgi:hypothetical protein